MRESLTARTLKGAAWIGGASVVRLRLARRLGRHPGAALDAARIRRRRGCSDRDGFRSDDLRDGACADADPAEGGATRPRGDRLFLPLSWRWSPQWDCGMQPRGGVDADPELTQILKVLAWLTPSERSAFSARRCSPAKCRSRGWRCALFSFTISTFLVGIPMAWYGFGYWSLVAMQAVDIVLSAAMLGFAARELLVWPTFSAEPLGALAAEPWVHDQSTLFLSRVQRRQVHRPRSRYGGVRPLHSGSFFATTAATLFANIARLSVFPAMAKCRKTKRGFLNALKSFFLLALPTLLSAHFASSSLPSSSIFCSETNGTWPSRHSRSCPGRCISRSPGATAPRSSRRSTSILDNRRSHLPSGGAHCRNLWIAPHGLTAICAVIGVVMALMLGIMLIIVKHAIDLPPRSMAAAHFHPL